MGSYRIIVQPSAERELYAVPFSFRRQLNIQFNKLKDDPAPSGSEVVDGELMRLRLHGWRVLYEVDEEAGVVTILAVSRG